MILEALEYLRDRDESSECFAAAMRHVQVSVDESMIMQLRTLAETAQSDLLFTFMFYTGAQNATSITTSAELAATSLTSIQQLDHTRLSTAGITNLRMSQDQIALLMALMLVGDIRRVHQLMYSIAFDNTMLLDAIEDRLSAGSLKNARIIIDTAVNTHSFQKNAYLLTPEHLSHWISLWERLETQLTYNLLEVLIGRCLSMILTRDAFKLLDMYPNDQPPSTTRMASVFEQSVFKMKPRKLFPQSNGTHQELPNGRFLELDGYSPHILRVLQNFPPIRSMRALSRMYKRLYFKFSEDPSLSSDAGLVPFHLIWPVVNAFSLSGLDKAYNMSKEECYIFLRRPASHTLLFFNLSSTTNIQITALVRHHLHQLQHILHHSNQPNPLETAPSRSLANAYKRTVATNPYGVSPISFFVSSLLIYRDRWGSEWAMSLMYNIVYEHVKYHSFSTVMDLLNRCRAHGLEPTSRLIHHSANWLIRDNDNPQAAYELVGDNFAYIRRRDCGKVIFRLAFRHPLTAMKLYRKYLLSIRGREKSRASQFMRNSLMQIIAWSNRPPGTKLKHLLWINGMQVGIRGLHGDRVFIGCALRILATEYRYGTVPPKFIHVFFHKARRILGNSPELQQIENLFGNYQFRGFRTRRRQNIWARQRH